MMTQYRTEPSLAGEIAELKRRVRVLESANPGRQRSHLLDNTELLVASLTGSNNVAVGSLYSAGNVGMVAGAHVVIGTGGDITGPLSIQFPFNFADVGNGQDWICAVRAINLSPTFTATGLGVIVPGSDTALDFVTLSGSLATWNATYPVDWGPGAVFDFLAVGMIDYAQAMA